MSAGLVHVTHATILRDRRVHLRFDDGVAGEADLRPLLWGPMFAELATDDRAFAQMFVDARAGTIAWPNNADIAPETLHAIVTAEPARH